MLSISHACRTHIGMQRELNEDLWLYEPDLPVWLVLDGMGGHGAGDLASRLAGDSIIKALGQGSGLMQALQIGHDSITQAAKQGQGAVGMGCTCVALLLHGEEYQIAWLGDCRAYVWQNGLKRLTKDHSYVQDLVDAGILSETEAQSHPKRNIVTRALGGGELNPVRPSVLDGRAQPGQRFLLCSDGLCGELPDRKIESIIAGGVSDQETVDRLIDEANRMGGADNITAVMVTMQNGI